jgi:hypothetical protein
MNTNQHPADQLGMLLAQVAELTKQADAIKAQLKDVATDGGPTVFEGTFFKSTFVEANRNVVDHKAMIADLGLTEAYLAKFTSVTAVFSIKTTSR